jgi:hypothetical protein
VSSISVTNVDQLRGIVVQCAQPWHGNSFGSKLEKDSEKLYSLVRELQDLPLPEVEIHLTRFQGMTQTQLGLLAKYCHKLKAVLTIPGEALWHFLLSRQFVAVSSLTVLHNSPGGSDLLVSKQGTS